MGSHDDEMNRVEKSGNAPLVPGIWTFALYATINNTVLV